jgi:hypothetical protein
MNKRKQRTIDYLSSRTHALTFQAFKLSLEQKQAEKEEKKFLNLLRNGLIAEARSEREIERLIV